VGLGSCKEKEKDEYKVVCAQIFPGGVGFCPARMIVQSETPIANTNPVSGAVSFFVYDTSMVPEDFWGESYYATATVVFRLTGKRETCFVELPIIEILSIEKCDTAGAGL